MNFYSTTIYFDLAYIGNMWSANYDIVDYDRLILILK